MRGDSGRQPRENRKRRPGQRSGVHEDATVNSDCGLSLQSSAVFCKRAENQRRVRVKPTPSLRACSRDAASAELVLELAEGADAMSVLEHLAKRVFQSG